MQTYKSHYCIVIMCFFCFGFQSVGPEFARMADEPHIILELPGSIVVNFVLTTKILKLISLLIS